MKPITESLKFIVRRVEKSQATCIWESRRCNREKPNKTEDFQTHSSSSSFSSSSCWTAPTSCCHTCDFTRRRGRGGIFSFKSAGAPSLRWRSRRRGFGGLVVGVLYHLRISITPSSVGQWRKCQSAGEALGSGPCRRFQSKQGSVGLSGQRRCPCWNLGVEFGSAAHRWALGWWSVAFFFSF